ncbi:MAG: hypothetical protein KA314_04775 [Chloroflexi bacterium]|nr:hypothetical protein [Chloroflexota bacterium]
MARDKTFPGIGRLLPASYKAFPAVKEFLAQYGGDYGSNASEGARTAIRRYCELSPMARRLMGVVVADGHVPPPGVQFQDEQGETDDEFLIIIEDLGVNADASTRYGETMEGGSVTLTPAEMEFLKRLGRGVGGGLRLVVQELVRLGDVRACQILDEIGRDKFVPARWAEYAATVLAV